MKRAAEPAAFVIVVALTAALAWLGFTNAGQATHLTPYEPPGPPSSQIFPLSNLAWLLRLVLTSLATHNFTVNSTELTSLVNAAEKNPLIESNPYLLETVRLTNDTYFKLRAAYLDSQAATSAFSSGLYEAAIYYANRSYSEGVKGLQDLSTMENVVPQLSSAIGEQNASLLTQYLAKVIALAQTLLEYDQLIIQKATLYLGLSVYRNASIHGNISVVLVAPREAWLGELINLSGVVVVNGSAPAPNALVSITLPGVLGSSKVVEANEKGLFWATVKPVFNESGLLCVEAQALAVGNYSGMTALSTVTCLKLLYFTVHLAVNLSPLTPHPGQNVTLTGSYLGPSACLPANATVCVAGICTHEIIKGNYFTYQFKAPMAGGTYTVVASVPPAGNCSPAHVVAPLYVEPYNTSLIVRSPPLWLGLLPMPVSGEVVSSFGPTPWDVVTFNSNGRSITVYAGVNGSFHAELPTPLGWRANLSACAYPLNATFARSCWSSEVTLIPTPVLLSLLVPIGAWQAIKTSGKTRDRTRAEVAMVTQPEAEVIADPLIREAWGYLERAAGVSRLEAEFMTARELAARSKDRSRAMSIATMIERAVYGPGLTEEERGRLRELLSWG
ncbi:MAG: hypothetical protein ACP5HK_06905 [Acidilobus sp.]